MSGTGATSPLPLRLGVIDSSGLSAADHARTCADLVSVARVIPTMRMRVQRSGSSYSVTAYRGLYEEPEVLSIGSGFFQFYLPEMREDYDGTSCPSAIEFLTVTSASPLNTDLLYVQEVSATSTNRSVWVGTLADGGSVTITAFGSDLDFRRIQDYGGASDKRDSASERVPYAWSALEMLRNARGSAYSRETGNLVHAENLTLARAHAMNWRNAERVQTNANPETAWEKSEEWRSALGVRPRPGDTPADVRVRCGAKFRASQGPRQQVNDDAISKLLGTLYVRTWREYGDDLATPPTVTHWPGVNAGLSGYDLGGGAWYSERCHMMIEVTQPSDVGLSEFIDKMDQLYELLDRQMPAYVTFDWGVNVEGGFVLDESQLDFGALSRIGT